MNKENVLEMIQELNEKQTETICIETKTANAGKPEKYYDTISSFSNTIGGVILFGVEEKKHKNKTTFEVVGVYDANDLQKNITNLCSTEFEPVIRPEINIINIEDKNVVAVRIDALNQRNKPCYYKPKGLHNGAYTRIGDRDDHMTEYEIYKCISYRENAKDDLKAVTRATIKDLDENLLNKFIVNAKIDKPKFAEFSDEEILLQYGVLTQVEDKIFPTVAGVMVFGIYPQRFFPQWFVAAIVIPGFEVANLGEVGQRFDDNKRIEGNIAEMYQETISFISRNMKVKVIISDKTGLRTDITQYPIDALREAIANMIIHRDYSDLKTGVYSMVTIYKDRIEFRNVGNLYGSNTLELLKTRKAMEVRNETIVKLLEILGGIIENRHTGISTMEDKMKEAKLPEPIFVNEREDFVVTFYNGEYPELYPEELKIYENIKMSDKTSDKTSNKASDKIFEYLKQNEYITTNIASELLELSQQRARAILSKMAKDSLIIAKGANRNRKYIINKV
jgi:ATP-dependent DNA helicase RecG